LNEESAVGGLSIKVLNNPGRNYFTLNIQTNNSEKINVRLFDIYGRIVETKNNLSGSQQLRVGDKLIAGIYLVELTQGKQVKLVKLIKMN